jgi:hypothetical protein
MYKLWLASQTCTDLALHLQIRWIVEYLVATLTKLHKIKSKFQFLHPNFIILMLITLFSKFLSKLPYLVKIVPIFTPSNCLAIW